MSQAPSDLNINSKNKKNIQFKIDLINERGKYEKEIYNGKLENEYASR